MYEDDDFEPPESYTSISFKFKTIRIVDNVITAFTNVLNTEVYIDEDADDVSINVALEKIHFWFDYIVSNGILFNRDNEFALSLMFDEHGLSKTANIPIVLPDEPSDDIICAMLHSKLNALGNNVMHFGNMNITSDTKENLVLTFIGMGELMLPAMDEWIGARAFHDKPWWSRNDGSTLDIIPLDDSDLSEPPDFGVDLTFIEDRFQKKTSNTSMVIRPEFKPQVINGGKTDDDPKN